MSQQVSASSATTTIRDVAKAAGVSLSTVSRVLSGGRATDDDIADRVHAAAAALDFRPNPAAQHLRRPVSTVGVVVPDLANPYFSEVLKGIHAAAELLDQRMLVADAHEDPTEEARLVRELARWSSGIVLCSPRLPARRLRETAALPRRLVTVNRTTPGRPSVAVDFAAGVRALCQHLRDLGHRHIAYLQGPELAGSDAERRRALRSEERRGVRVDVVPCGPGTDDGHAATDRALGTGATAIVAFSDYVALGVMLRLGELGLSVPGDVSVTGFDDIPVSRLVGPGLTTASVSKPELGKCAHELLEGKDSDRRVRLPPSLVIRGSTGRPAEPRPGARNASRP